MLNDPYFYLVSIPAVLLYGIAKGGFGGSIAVLAVPLMTLVMSPTRAAAILLPILLVMDVLVVRTYWKVFQLQALKIMLPGALVGIVLGYLTVGAMNDSYMRILVGTISVVFGLQQLFNLSAHLGKQHHYPSGILFGALAGFTSFSIHAGGPPYTIYMLPKKLDPLLFAGTAGIFFAVVNFAKVVPYYYLDQLNFDNLLLSAVLIPIAPLGVKLGHWLVKKSNLPFYYHVISFFLLVVGAKLLLDGLNSL